MADFDDTYDEDDEKPSLIKKIIIALVVLSVLAGLAYLLKGLFDTPERGERKITTIKLKDPPPPPPPPPPPKEKPKEVPKKIEKKIKQEAPKPKPVETPPQEQLKMEGAAGDGPSPFAAGQVTEEYKGGDVGTKKTIGGGKSKRHFAWYTGLIKSQIEAAIANDKSLSTDNFKVVVKIWLTANGGIKRYRLIGSTGNAERDAKVKQALDSMPAISEAPPSDMPQPVKLRVTARSFG